LSTVQSTRPISWIDDHTSMISKLTLSEVNAAIKKYINPDALVEG